MSKPGPKQHYIPQHFIGAWKIADSKKPFVWQFRRGTIPSQPVPIESIAYEKNFYSKRENDEQVTLDDIISDYEDEVRISVDHFRSMEPASHLDPRQVASVASHFAMRGAFLRELLHDSSAQLFHQATTAISDGSFLGLDGKTLHTAPDKIWEAIGSEIDVFLQTQNLMFSKKLIINLLYFAMRENPEKAFGNALNDLGAAFSSIVVDLPKKIRETHNELLSAGLVIEKHIQRLSRLNWRIEDLSAGKAILPDFIVLAKDASGWQPLLLADHERLECVALPLAPGLLAVGRSKGSRNISIESFNENAAQSCSSFFLADCFTDSYSELWSDLGVQVRGIIDETINDAFETVKTQASKVSSGRSRISSVEVGWNDLQVTNSFSVSAQSPEIDSEDVLRDIGLRIGGLVQQISFNFPVGQLDGFTFALDYESALKTLDRGFEPTKFVQSETVEGAHAVAMALIVKRSDQLKTHIVVRDYIALDLVGQDQELQRRAEASIRGVLASSSYNELLSNKFPDLYLKKNPDLFEGWLFSFTENLFHTFFQTRLSEPSRGDVDFYEDLAFRAFANLLNETASANLKFRGNQDHEVYFSRIAPKVISFLSAHLRLCAVDSNWFADRPQRSNYLSNLLKFHLKAWSDMFARDAYLFYDQIEEWRNFEEIYLFNRHFERILGMAGVLPDEMSDGRFYIHTTEDVPFLVDRHG